MVDPDLQEADLRISRIAALAVFAFAATAAAQACAGLSFTHHFFDADNGGYQAWLDPSDQTRDAQGYRLASVKYTNFSPAFREWIEKNFPKAGSAAWAIDPYSVDCSTRQLAEHRLVWYDSNGFPITDYDFGGKMGPPITGSMKFYLLKEICGG